MTQLNEPHAFKAYVEKCETVARQGVPVDWRQVAINVAASAEEKIAELSAFADWYHEGSSPSQTEPDSPAQS